MLTDRAAVAPTEAEPTYRTWDVAQVVAWLESVQLGAFSPQFRDKHCTGLLLSKLANALLLLSEFGITSDLDRIRILAEIDQLVGRVGIDSALHDL